MFSNIEHILDRLFNATDSDDVELIATFVEYNISKEERSKLEKMLKESAYKNGTNTDEALRIKQLLNFLE